MRKMRPKTLFIFLALLLSSQAHSGEWRVGGSIGFGGTGITNTQSVDGVQTTVQRSEGPGVFSVFADRLVTDTLGVGFEHLRGFRMGPFSSGASFTGIVARWYFMGPAPSVAKTGEVGTLLIKRFTPYLGIHSGVARADIERRNDKAPSVSGSSVYLGFKVGAEYAMAPGWGIRPELTTATTLLSNETPATTLQEFGLHMGFYIYF